MYFNEKNANGQCLKCNYFGSGKTSIYAMKLVKKYGPDILEELNPYPREELKSEDLLAIIEKYA